MPILDNPSNPVTASLSEFLAPFNSIFTTPPKYRGADFPEGFIVTELLDSGEPGEVVKLVGRLMPFQPFEHGKKQHLVKEYYPGSKEPAVQVFGSRENETTIRGRLKAKHYPTEISGLDARLIPLAIQETLDDICERGTLCRFQLGEWQRYGWIEETSWKMKTKADIDYEIQLFLIGDEPPTNCKIATPELTIPIELNNQLIGAAAAFEAYEVNKPLNFPRTLGDTVNELIGSVATAVSVVTKFVDQTISTAEGARKLAERGIGLVRYARATVSTFKRRIGSLQMYDVASSADEATRDLDKMANAKFVLEVQNGTQKAPSYVSDAMRTQAESKAGNYTVDDQTTTKALETATGPSIEGLLARMEEQFKAMARTVPRARHLVREGQSLQQISMQYYGTAENWKSIYDHNKLSSTVLTAGAILEIPKL